MKDLADELAINTGHLYGGGDRGRRELSVSDEQLAEIISTATSWTDVARRFGYATTLRGMQAKRIADRVDRLGLSTTHFRARGYNGRDPFPAIPSAFKSAPDPKRLRGAAEGKAIAWFVERGYGVSLPLEAEPYDLIVDGRDGQLHRIQVKSSTQADRSCGFTRHSWDRTKSQWGRVSYEPGDVDYFFVVLIDGSLYLIPYEVIGRSRKIVVGPLYEEFRISPAADMLA
jgi:hypothetical protein